ncbi:MAG: recombinase family protein [Bacilli bacterium]|nr:recombinase family protein [Bacilli bacterium]
MELKKRKKAIYSRKSKYTGKGESIENQIDTCKHYLKTYIDPTLNDEDIVVFNDEGYTGANTDRPQFQEMMKRLKDDEFDTIVCYRLDRVSRNVLDFANLYEDWQEHDVDFVSVSERFDTTTPMGKAMLFIAITFAQLERDTIAERIRDNMYKLAKTGRWLGGNVPLGFMSEKMEKLNINGKKTNLFKLVPVDEEISIINTIFSKFLELKSQTKVESYLIQNDFKTKRDCDFSRWGVKNILRNPVYAIADKDMLDYFVENEVEVYNEADEFDGQHGIIGYCKTEKTKTGRVKYKDLQDWIVAIGEHKGIIKGKDWVEVQNLLKMNEDKNYRKPIKNNAILVGVLRCSHCNSLMRAKLKQNKTANGDLRFDYICDLKMKSKGEKCSCKNVNGNEADNLVIDGMKALANPTSEFYQAIKEIANDNEYDKKNKNDELQLLERNYSKNESEINSLVNRLALVDDEVFDDVQAKIKELKKRNKEIATNIKKIKSEKPMQIINDQETAKIVFDILNSYINKFEELDIIGKRNLIKLFVGNMQTDGKNIYMDLIGSRNHTLTTKPQLFDNDNNNTQDGLSATHNGQIVLSSDSGE